MSSPSSSQLIINRSKQNSVAAHPQHPHQQHPHPQHAHKHGGLNKNQIPPDWELAAVHAVLFFINAIQARETKPEREKISDKDFEKVCQCCGYEIKRVPINMSTPTLDLGFLGSGFPLYYNYLKYCCIMLASLFIFQGLPNIYMNYKGSFCDKTMLEVYEALEEQKNDPKSNFLTPCPSSLTNKISIANILNTMEDGGSSSFHFSTVAMIAQIILCILFRKEQREIEIQVDKDNITPADYTIWVKKLPKILSNPKQDIENFFKQLNFNVQKVVLVYDLSEIEELENQFKQAIKQKQKFLKKNNSKPGYPEEQSIEKKLRLIEEQIGEKEKKIQNDTKKFAGSAFVSFETEHDKDKLFAINSPGLMSRIVNFFFEGRTGRYNESFHMNGQIIEIIDAPEPNDVDWEVAHCSTKDKYLARAKSFIQWAGLIAISFSIICMITYLQASKIDHINEELLELEKESKEHGKTDVEQEAHIQSSLRIVSILSFIISTGIVLFNKFALPFLVHHIVDHEKWSTKTKLNTSFAFKLTIALFFNTALITFLVEIILFFNFYGIGGGMIYSEALVFIFNAVIPSLAWIIDPWSILKNYQRNKELKNKKASVLTQEEANELMEHPDYAMGKRYADIMKTMWFTFFFSPVIPIGSLFSFFGLVFYYFTDKYNLIYRRTVKESIGSELSFEMIELQEYSVVLHCLGNFMFKWMLSKYFDMTSLILFIISIVITLFPMGPLNECLFKFDKEAEEKVYSQAKHQFDTDYDRENPITKDQALLNFTQNRTMSKLFFISFILLCSDHVFIQINFEDML